MPPALPNQNIPCCATPVPCEPNVGPPGIAGPQGPAGSDGIIGGNAYTVLTESFIQPAVDASVVVDVESGLWASVGQHVYVSSGGDYIVDGASATQLTLINTGEYGNVAPTTVVASANTVSPAGVPGPAGSLTGAAGGSLAGMYPNPTIAASGVSAGVGTKFTVGVDGRITVRANLSASDIPAINASTQLTGVVPIANGGTGESVAGDAFDALAPTTSDGDLIVFDGGTNVRLAVGSFHQSLRAGPFTPQWESVRYDLIGDGLVDCNTTGDSIISIWPTNWIIRRIIAFNASVSLTTLAGGIYTAASKGGSQVVASSQVYTALTGGSKYLDLTLNGIALTDVLTVSQLYFSPTTPQGTAATMQVFVYGDNLG